MIALLQVNLGKHPTTSQSIQDVVYPGDWVPVNNSIGIEPAVINTHSHGAIFLLGKQDGVCIDGLTHPLANNLSSYSLTSRSLSCDILYWRWW